MDKSQKLTSSQLIDVRNFSQDLFHYVFAKYQFKSKYEFITALELRALNIKTSRTSYFEQSIGKAVEVSQLFLREFCRRSFDFTFSKSTFKHDVKKICFMWLEERGDILIKVVDVLAFIAEVFLYCDSNKKYDVKLNEATDWFIEWFDENLSLEFFKNSSWLELDEFCSDYYKPIYDFLKRQETLSDFMSYKPLIHNCSSMQYLRYSCPVQFPIPNDLCCEKCSYSSDKKLSIVYVRLLNEVVSVVSPSEIKVTKIKGNSTVDSNISSTLLMNLI